MSSVATKSAARIPPPVLETSDTLRPVSVTTVAVELEVAESSDKTMTMGMLQISLKNDESRSSFSG